MSLFAKGQRKGTRASRVFAGVLVALVVFGVALSLLGGKRGGVDGSVVSNGDGGRLAVSLVLQELGFEVQSWSQAPLFLPRTDQLLWMAQTPGGTWGQADPGPAARDESPRNPLYYAEFVRAGGTLLLPYSTTNFAWLLEGCGLELPAWEAPPAVREYKLELETGEELHVRSEVLSEGMEPPSVEQPGPSTSEHPGRWHDFAWDAEGRPFISWFSVGQGRVVLLAEDLWLDNGRLATGDNGLLLVRLVEALQPSQPLLFDEFALGLWTPATKFELMAAPGFLGASLHLFLAFLVFLLFQGWVREFPRDPAGVRLDPRLRGQAQVALFERAQRFEWLARDLQLGVLSKLHKGFGLRAPGPALNQAQQQSRMLKEIVSYLTAPHAVAECQRLFAPGDYSNQPDLEQLGRDLRAFELQVQVARSPRNHSPSPSS